MNDSIFQLNEISCESKLIYDIVSILQLGNKFVPNYFCLKKQFFNFLLKDLDENIIKFDTFLNISKNNLNKDPVDIAECETLNNINNLDSAGKILFDDKNINKILNDVNKKYKKIIKKNEEQILNKKFINNESLSLRENIQKELINNYDEINIQQNLNHSQLRALLFFKKTRPFKVIDCDKNVGCAIISNDFYNESVYNYLNSDPTYEVISSNPLKKTVTNINQNLKLLLSNSHISERMNKVLKLKEEDCKLGSFRLLAKLHKPSFSWRAIINCKNHPTSKISILFDFLIKPIIIKTESYIKDSQNLIQLCENIKFERKPFIYSFDVSNLYTNIKPNIAIPMLTEFISSYLDTQHLSPYGFKTLLSVFFENNYFMFKNTYYLQKTGCPMGCICGPTIANLFLYILERKWLYIHKPIVYYRFIDDIFMVLKNVINFEEFESTFIDLKLSMITGDVVNFLDMNISYNQIINKLKYSLYTKETNTFSYLLPISNHPSHIFINIPKSLFIRIRRICSDYYDFTDAAKKLGEQLFLRGYNPENIRKTFNLISNINRNNLIQYKPKNKFLDFSKNIPFFTKFECSLSNFNKIIYSSYNKTSFLNSVLNNFNLNIINTININLNKLFVHNFKIPSISKCKTIKCNSCFCCKFIYENSFITLKDSKISIQLLSNSNCDSSHVVYIILCEKCKIFYIGETRKSLSKRMSQHLNQIKKYVPFKKYHDKEVAKHFNLKGHKLDDFKCCVYKDNLTDNNKRKSIEKDLINFLNLNYKSCINIHTSTNNLNALCFN